MFYIRFPSYVVFVLVVIKFAYFKQWLNYSSVFINVEVKLSGFCICHVIARGTIRIVWIKKKVFRETNTISLPDAVGKVGENKTTRDIIHNSNFIFEYADHSNSSTSKHINRLREVMTNRILFISYHIIEEYRRRKRFRVVYADRMRFRGK